MTIGRVAQLWRYPVKSLGGEQVEHAEFGARGVLGDRLWAIRDLERGITASARQLPVLLTATARYPGPVPPDAGPGDVPEVEITFPDGAILSSSDGGVNAKLCQLAGRDVELTALPPAEDSSLHRLNREQRADAMSPASVRAAFGVSEGEKLPDLSMVRVSDLVTLARYSTPPGMFVDLAPVHVMTKNSLATIGAEVGSDMDVRRFRPNVLLALDDSDEDLPESRWTRAHLVVGEVVLDVTMPTIRWCHAQPCSTRVRGQSTNHPRSGHPSREVPRCLLLGRTRRQCKGWRSRRCPTCNRPTAIRRRRRPARDAIGIRIGDWGGGSSVAMNARRVRRSRTP